MTFRLPQMSGCMLMVAIACALLAPSSASAADELAIAPDWADFGEVASGLRHGWQLNVRNDGPDAIQLGDIGIEGDVEPFSFEDGGCLDVLALEAGESCALGVVFHAPMETADYEAVLFVEGDGVDPGLALLTASSFLEGYLTADPAVVNVGSTPIGTTSSPRSVRIRNAGDSPVTISEVSVPGPVSITPFRVTANDCVGVLEPGQDCLVEVVFTPNTEWGLGHQGAALFVRRPSEWGLLIPLNGMAARPRSIGPSAGLEIALSDLTDAVPALIRGGPARWRSLPAFSAPIAGRLSLTLFGWKGARRLRIGAGMLKFDAPKAGGLRFRLNKKGVALLRRPQRTRVKVVAKFESRDGVTSRQGPEFLVKRPLKRKRR